MILWGQSAGANAVVTYSYANADDPIVRGLVANSGSAPSGTAVDTSSFSKMAASFGCGNLTASDELTCMQKMDASRLQKYVLENSKGGFGGPRLGGYVADNVTVFSNYTERLLKGRVAKVVSYGCSSGIKVIKLISRKPLITGVTKNEGAAFAPFTLNQTVGSTPEDLAPANAMFVCGVDAEAKYVMFTSSSDYVG